MQVKRSIIVSIAFIMSFLQVTIAQNFTGNEYYEKAYTEMADMLEGKSPISIRRAVFVAECAYLDGNLDYEKDFCEPILKDVAYMKRWMNANNLSQYKTAKQMTLCNFFFYPWSGNRYTPFRYDFDEKESWNRQLVSKVLKTHKGQCHSLPWTFILYAEELGANAYLARAPRHCYVMYKDEDNQFPEDWVNVELTSQQYIPTWAQKDQFEIKDSAVIVGTYMSPLTKKETIACQLSELALSYYTKYRVCDAFTLKCTTKALEYYKMNPNAIIIKAKSLEAQLITYLRYNGGFSDSITDELDYKLSQCSQDLRNTHWTQETEELRRKWNKTKEEADSLKQNVIIIK
ncbi:MAG: hypothetical protein NC344_01780 [Bacteroidales bacterium]|nr:hypothetical protein [Bacteroidales bacterium]MCM1205956.1 hypothetical protein [Bacillota bacterium]MCM1510164.1 hypothetical protein [Clostridium sp.]